MAIYTVYLVNLGKLELPQDDVALVLRGYFDLIVKEAGGYEGALVKWVKDQPTVLDNELLVYFVKNGADSILRSLGAPKTATTGDGLTFITTSVTGSEVYASAPLRDKPKLLANLAFHEMMHNKSSLGDGLHGKGGGGLAASTVYESTALTAKNIKFMSSRLGDTVKQWTGGFSAYNDPLRFAD